jgi:hypothetical protein
VAVDCDTVLGVVHHVAVHALDLLARGQTLLQRRQVDGAQRRLRARRRRRAFVAAVVVQRVAQQLHERRDRRPRQRIAARARAEAVVDRAVGVHQHDRERQVEVEAQQAHVDVAQVGDAHAFVRRRSGGEFLRGTDQLSVQVAAVLSALAAEQQQQRPVLLGGLGARAREVGLPADREIVLGGGVRREHGAQRSGEVAHAHRCSGGWRRRRDAVRASPLSRPRPSD